MNPLGKNEIQWRTVRYFTNTKLDHLVPLFERKSRIKFKREKILKKIQVQIQSIQRNKKNHQQLFKESGIIDNAIVEQIKGIEECFLKLQKEQYKKNENPIIEKSIQEDISRKTLLLLSKENLYFMHIKRIFYFINKSENTILINYIPHTNFVKICVFMKKKHIRNEIIEKEFLKRTQICIEQKNDFCNEHNFIPILEYIHFIGLNNISCFKTFRRFVTFKKLQIIYNDLMDSILPTLFEIKDIMEIIRVNDTYLYFNEALFNHINEMICSDFPSFHEHTIVSICKHLSKMLFFFAIQEQNIPYTFHVHQLLKRYICKSIVLPNGFFIKSIENSDIKRREEEPVIQQESFKRLIQKSPLVKILNEELKMHIHEYKFYNLVDMFEFYTIFEIKNENMIKRFFNEVSKCINLMKYGYHSRVLILFSVNRKWINQLEMEEREELDKYIKRIIRRIPYMLNFRWPIEIIIETMIACSTFHFTKIIFKDLLIYMKNHIYSCIHESLLVSLVKGLMNVGKAHYILCSQILLYLKQNIERVDMKYAITILHHLSYLEYSDTHFVYFLLTYKNRIIEKIESLSFKYITQLMHVLCYYRTFLENIKQVQVGPIQIQSNVFIFFVELVLSQFIIKTIKPFCDRTVPTEPLLDECRMIKWTPDEFIYFLYGINQMKITNEEIFKCAIDYLENHVKEFNQMHITTLLQFCSEQLLFPTFIDNIQRRKIYMNLKEILNHHIYKLSEDLLPRSIFFLVGFLFEEGILKNEKTNIDLVEDMLIMCCNKFTGGSKILKKMNEEETEGSVHLLHVIVTYLKKYYLHIQERMPNEIFFFCNHVKQEYSRNSKQLKHHQMEFNVEEEHHRFFEYFSTLLKNKKIDHFLKYEIDPFILDIVLVNEKGIKDKALFIVNSMNILYIYQFKFSSLLHDLRNKNNLTIHNNGMNNYVYTNELFNPTLNLYEIMKEWFLKTEQLSVSYVSKDQWKNYT